jgi:YfiH family protein
MSADARTAPAIRTADCVPVLIACTETGVVCAVHAGWRGIVAGVVPQAIGAMRAAHGARPGGMVAAIGPCIGRDVYEVGPDVAAEFAKVVGDAFVLPAGGGRAKEHIDCFGAVRSQLKACGIPAESVDGEELCTVATPREFFSYRRDGARSGRMASVVVPRR